MRELAMSVRPVDRVDIAPIIAGHNSGLTRLTVTIGSELPGGGIAYYADVTDEGIAALGIAINNREETDRG